MTEAKKNAKNILFAAIAHHIPHVGKMQRMDEIEIEEEVQRMIPYLTEEERVAVHLCATKSAIRTSKIDNDLYMRVITPLVIRMIKLAYKALNA
jgi:hypothetical protein